MGSSHNSAIKVAKVFAARFALFTVLFFCLAGTLLNGETCALNAEWKGTFSGTKGSGTISATFTQAGGSISGTVTVMDSKGSQSSDVTGTETVNSVTFGPVTVGNSTLYANGTFAVCSTLSGDFTLNKPKGTVVGSFTIMPAVFLSADSTDVAPSIMSDPFVKKPTTVNLTATLANGVPDGQIDFSAKAIDLQSAGGHDHTNITSVLVGAFDKDAFSTKPTSTCTTTGGSCTAMFTVSEVSGSYSITAKLDTDASASYDVPVMVRIQSLAELSSGATYRLTGATTKHLSNHSGAGTLIRNIQAVSKMYFNNSATKGQTLGINDMSLSEGGLFDISGAWTVPHKLHRTGDSVDIDHKTFKGSQAGNLNLTLLTSLMKAVKMYQVPEGSSIHFQISGVPETLPALTQQAHALERVTDAGVTASIAGTEDGLLTYTYTFSNASSSQAPVAAIQMDISKSAAGVALSNKGLIQGDRSLVDYEGQLLSSRSSTPIVPAGLSLPQGWVGLISLDGFVNWSAETELDFLRPNEWIAGYQLTSPGLPAIRKFKASPFLDVERLGLRPPTSEADLPRYESELRAVEETVSFTGYTVGPAAPPKDFDAAKFMGTISEYKRRSDEFGWIRDGALSFRLGAWIATTETMISAGNNDGTKETLTRLLNEIESNPTGLSSQASALLKFNLKYLLAEMAK
jgi:hypothetical protein